MNLGHSSGSGARHAHKPPRDHVRVAMMKAARRARTGVRASCERRGAEVDWAAYSRFMCFFMPSLGMCLCT